MAYSRYQKAMDYHEYVQTLTRSLNATKTYADEILVREGERWYQTANEFAYALATDYGYTLEQCACVIAVYSPQTPWQENMSYAQRACAGERTHGKYPGSMGAKAGRILSVRGPLAHNMEYLSTFVAESWRKTYNFAYNIAQPDNDTYVTIDSHMAKFFNRPESSISVKGRYQVMADAVRYVARANDLTAPAVQAIAWCLHRGKAN